MEFDMDEKMFGDEIFTLTDEDGNESQFEILGTKELDGCAYFALFPKDGNDDEEYVILKLATDENGEEILVTIDDDDEFERIAGIFDDELFGEIDYDAEMPEKQ
ncbi:MAG: DUF1292 domain-containing protein [Clostridia bacterium]|nr:DUF1292 domain-containing protein [Clostridia bacterium]